MARPKSDKREIGRQAKLAAVLRTVMETSTPISRQQIARATGISLPTVRTAVSMLEDSKLIYHYVSRQQPHGGPPEQFFLAGAKPEGFKPGFEPLTAEQLAARDERRRNKMKEYTRRSKEKRRAALVGISYSTAIMDDWYDPNWQYKPSAYAEPASILMQIWYPAIKGEHHETST